MKPVGFDICCTKLFSVNTAKSPDVLTYGKNSAETRVQEQGLSPLYHRIPVPTFNLFLLFPKERAYLRLRPGLVGHKYPHSYFGVMEDQCMINIHEKSPVRQALIPVTKHAGSKTLLRNTCAGTRTKNAKKRVNDIKKRVLIVYFER